MILHNTNLSKFDVSLSVAEIVTDALMGALGKFGLSNATDELVHDWKVTNELSIQRTMCQVANLAVSCLSLENEVDITFHWDYFQKCVVVTMTPIIR